MGEKEQGHGSVNLRHHQKGRQRTLNTTLLLRSIKFAASLQPSRKRGASQRRFRQVTFPEVARGCKHEARAMGERLQRWTQASSDGGGCAVHGMCRCERTGSGTLGGCRYASWEKFIRGLARCMHLFCLLQLSHLTSVSLCSGNFSPISLKHARKAPRAADMSWMANKKRRGLFFRHNLADFPILADFLKSSLSDCKYLGDVEKHVFAFREDAFYFCLRLLATSNDQGPIQNEGRCVSLVK